MIDIKSAPTRALLASILTALLAVAAGCSGLPEWRTIRLTDTSGAPLMGRVPSLDIENGRGTVTVTIDPRIKKPEVLANVYPEPGMTKPMRQEAASGSGFTAEVVETDGAPVVKVRGSPAAGGRTAAVEITVRLPACRGVTVHNSGGAVRLAGVSGPITVENGAGGGPGGMVIVRTGVPVTDPVTLTTTSGEIYLQIPPASTGSLDLLTLDGPAVLRCQGGRLTGVVPSSSSYRAVLNGGQNPLTLRSGKGMVRVTVLTNAGTHVPAE